jgi:shikimate kinase
MILFGFKGAGKTHLGKYLSRALNRPFIDTDDLICALFPKRGFTVRAIHQELGESAFRKLEKRAIQTLTTDANAVIALGGGAILDPDHVDYLQKIGRLIYLKASFHTIQKRISSFVDSEALYQIYCERLPIYESISAEVIDVDLLDEAGCLAALCSIACLEEPVNGL